MLGLGAAFSQRMIGQAFANSQPIAIDKGQIGQNSIRPFHVVVLQVSNADKFVSERLWCVLKLPNRRDCR